MAMLAGAVTAWAFTAILRAVDQAGVWPAQDTAGLAGGRRAGAGEVARKEGRAGAEICIIWAVSRGSCAPLAQSAEHIHGKDGVGGSIPPGGSTNMLTSGNAAHSGFVVRD